ncbi:MAG: dihydroorotate dehydrogenase electron transfer subunit [Thermoanaerobacteraceae bacterium]|nr:dihydroorotate dehydrogenase electron transfer subunit [Thermoanaerobacteraceae bacterium]
MMLSRIEYNERIADGVYVMGLDAGEIAPSARPGQFVHVLVDRDKYLLRRPFSICDVDGGTIKIMYRVKGVGTELMSRAMRGESMDIMGPLGKGFNEVRGRVAIVGGGIGLAPLVYLARRIKSGTMFIGFNDEPFGLDFISNPGLDIRVATTNGTTGYRGNVVDLFEDTLSSERYDYMYACGPKPMIKEIKRVCKEHEIPGEASFEERMGCALGACMVCSIPVKDGDKFKYKRICKDGPVFNIDEVIFGGVA